MRKLLLNVAEGCLAAMIAIAIGWLIGEQRPMREILIGSLIFVCVYVVVRPFISRFFLRANHA